MECLEFRRGRVEQGLEVRYPERSGGQRWIRLRRDRRGQYRRQGNCMRAPAPVERQAITILLLRPARCFTWSLALPRLGAARPLLFAREHEVLFAGYAPAPQECGADYERQERIGDRTKHELPFIMLHRAATVRERGLSNTGKVPTPSRSRLYVMSRSAIRSRALPYCFNEAISITKRYFTSLFNRRS